ncbi:hypothetical protein JTB14_037803 [Gonioctena quinquepunctata]|nr:hypothetical protein JTB14_037803 [Gonioctena quinquepunctata]
MNNPSLKIEERTDICQSHETFPNPPMNIIVNQVTSSPSRAQTRDTQKWEPNPVSLRKSKHKDLGEKFSEQINSMVVQNERQADVWKT